MFFFFSCTRSTDLRLLLLLLQLPSIFKVDDVDKGICVTIGPLPNLVHLNVKVGMKGVIAIKDVET